MIRLYAMTCGEVGASLQKILAGEEGQIRVPVPTDLIDHPRGQVVFDTGLHPQTGTDPMGRLGVAVAGVFSIELQPDEAIAARLATLGVAADRVRYLINSHLHFDHTGGNVLLPNARLIVQRREWEAGHDADYVRRNFFFPQDYDLGHDVLQVDGEHELFGDGRIVCMPTYGHTPGHQSLRVRLDSGDVVITADACYLRRTLEELLLPPVVADREAMLASLRRLRALRD